MIVDVLIELFSGIISFLTGFSDSFKVYAIGNIDYNKTDGNKIANFIIKLEENNYDSKKVFRQLLRDYTKQFELILGQYNIKSKRFNDNGRNSVKDGIVNEGHSNRTRTNQESCCFRNNMENRILLFRQKKNPEYF